MRLSQPFLARCLTRCGRIITFKHWHGSNFCKICQLQTVFSFHSIQFRNRSAIDLSILLLLIFIGADAPISTMIGDDRKRIRSRGRTVAPNSMESSSGLVSPHRVARPRPNARISVACKLRFITCYPSESLSARSSIPLPLLLPLPFFRDLHHLNCTLNLRCYLRLYFFSLFHCYCFFFFNYSRMDY